jgi:hypothetical protein
MVNMLATDKSRLTVHLDPNVDEKVRIFGVKHRKNLSEIVEASLLHCLDNRHFIEKLTKKEEEIDY